MTRVETGGIKKYFGEVKAVNGVDLRTEEGEFLVLLGPSGCGKTTLLRLVAGLEQPTAGEILFDGQVMNDLPPRARRIAMVFQSYALYPHMTVFRNIAFPLKAEGMKKGVIKEKVGWAAKLFKIEDLLNRRPRELSGGERQRVALARALVREPTVFLLDEPLSNLDAKLRASARDELKQFQNKIGITTIYVTHDQVEAMGMGDRIIVMHDGAVRQIGTPQEIYRDPADTFVATFLGSPPMNLIENNDFIVGFRPEQFLPKEIYDKQDDLLIFKFHVTRVEYLGADRLLYGSVTANSIGEGMAIAKLPLTVAMTVQPAERLEFAVPVKELRFFDKKTGLRTSPRPL